MQLADECPGLQSLPKKPLGSSSAPRRHRGAPARIKQRAIVVNVEAYVKEIDARLALGK
jgi:hypothetical protein